MSEIIGSMTISEAAALLPEPDQTYLGRWGETFGIPLSEFHIGHIRTYQLDRAREVAASVVDREVETLIALLRELHLAEEIGQYYKGPVSPNELTSEEIEALPLRARDYIKRLLQEITALRSDSARVEHQLKDLRRKHNWSRPRQ